MVESVLVRGVRMLVQGRRGGAIMSRLCGRKIEDPASAALLLHCCRIRIMIVTEGRCFYGLPCCAFSFLWGGEVVGVGVSLWDISSLYGLYGFRKLLPHGWAQLSLGHHLSVSLNLHAL
jgi:hypothetical protein